MPLCFPCGWNGPLRQSGTISRWSSFWLVAALLSVGVGICMQTLSALRLWAAREPSCRSVLGGGSASRWGMACQRGRAPTLACHTAPFPRAELPWSITSSWCGQHLLCCLGARGFLPKWVPSQVMLEGGPSLWNFDWDEAEGVGVGAHGYVCFLCSFLLSSVRP